MVPFSLRRIVPVLHSVQRNGWGSAVTSSGRKLQDLSVFSSAKQKCESFGSNIKISRIRTLCEEPFRLIGESADANVRTVGQSPTGTLIGWVSHLIKLNHHSGNWVGVR